MPELRYRLAAFPDVPDYVFWINPETGAAFCRISQCELECVIRYGALPAPGVYELVS